MQVTRERREAASLSGSGLPTQLTASHSTALPKLTSRQRRQTASTRSLQAGVSTGGGKVCQGQQGTAAAWPGTYLIHTTLYSPVGRIQSQKHGLQHGVRQTGDGERPHVGGNGDRTGRFAAKRIYTARDAPRHRLQVLHSAAYDTACRPGDQAAAVSLDSAWIQGNSVLCRSIQLFSPHLWSLPE